MTNHVKIRKINASDADTIWSLTRIAGKKDPELQKFVPGLISENEIINRERVIRWSNMKETGFAFLVHYEGKPAGFILAEQNQEVFNALDITSFCAEKYRYKGIMSKAIKEELIGFLKKEDPFYKKLFFYIKHNNKASIKSALKFGAKKLNKEDCWLGNFDLYEIDIK